MIATLSAVLASGEVCMEKNLTGVLRGLLVLFLALITTGCEAVGSIFEAGLWFGVILVMIVLGIAGFIVTKMRRS